MQRRACGILLHLTSLPSPFGVGDLGPGAIRFADFLTEAGQSCWQILPLTPTSTFIGNSPYSSDSAFAGNCLLVSPEVMIQDGWLEADDVLDPPDFDVDRVDFRMATAYKQRLLDLAFTRQGSGLVRDARFARFCEEHAGWLEDYGLFKAIKESLGGMSWTRWPAHLRDRDPQALAERREALAGRVLKEQFVQYLFFEQWRRVKAALASRDILIVGDAPIYVTQDSADVWANQALFKLGPDREPVFVAGVPPDYFSATGQRWGNPVYDWAAHKKDRFRWWVRRLGHNFALFDLVRLDHFRGFAGYWEIPAAEKTAVKGRWVDAPGQDLFNALLAHFPTLPIIAEDLGVITPDVRELRDAFGFPGMKVLQFCFGPEVGENRDAPHHHVENAVAYTGTHDNTTTLAWAAEEAGPDAVRAFHDYIGRRLTPAEAPWAMIRLAYMSVARLAVAPMQDILALDGRARMNRPSLAEGNWAWRCREDKLGRELAQRLKDMAKLYGRGRAPRPENGNGTTPNL